MIAQAFVRQFAAGQKIDLDVADQEIVLYYALARLNEIGLVGYPPGEKTPGPLLFKGGTALRKCIFGSTGRFSQDIDLDATHKNGFEEAVEAAFRPDQPYHGIEFSLPRFRYSQDDNFSGTVEYQHANGAGAFELQISYRLDPILTPVDLTLQEQSYFAKAGEECGAPRLFGLDPYEMIGEKIMACNRRQGGSSKDVYDLDLWAQRPFDERLVRRLAILKA
jgi:predicted nucleotidyltransferase component of viral defense system